MEEHIVKIKSITPVTHDVIRVVTEKPADYHFVPGQATEVAINKPAWKEERRPFTFTNLPNAGELEFTIKTYTNHEGVTNEMRRQDAGDELIVHDVWGAIAYKGPGLFIAGGAGITPFIAIFRHLNKEGNIEGNKLIFANKKAEDIIYRDELAKLLGDSFINILDKEKVEGMEYGMITEDLLRKHIEDLSQKFYICGPPPMMDAIQGYLKNIGVTEGAVVVEI